MKKKVFSFIFVFVIMQTQNLSASEINSSDICLKADGYNYVNNNLRYYCDEASVVFEDQLSENNIIFRTYYDQNMEVTKKYYYGDNNVLEHTDYYNDGYVSKSYYYSPNGQRTFYYEYDKSNNVVRKTTYNNDIKSTDAYYENNRIIKLESFDTSGNLQKTNLYYENGNNKTAYNYYIDKSYKNITYYNEEGIKTEYRTYQANGSYTKYVYYENGTTNREISMYDAANNITKRTLYNSSGKKVLEQVYYSNGTSIKSTFFDNGVKKEHSYYNTNNEKYEQINYDVNGKVTEHNYYNSNEIRRDKYTDSLLSERTIYNSNYLRKSNVKYFPNGKIQKEYTYDSKGRLLKTVEYNQNGSKLYVNTYNPDLNYKTRMDRYVNNKLRYVYEYRQDGSYNKIFYSRYGLKEKKEYFNKNKEKYRVYSYLNTSKLKNYKYRKVAACNMSGKRAKNTVVDIGFDSSYANRNYYAYTNKYGQLIRVKAALLIPQNEKYEKTILSTNGKTREYRYCYDEANVKGVSKTYHAGHIIADSWGGVANAYNITPEYYWVNLYGGQFKMEEDFRKSAINEQTITDFDMLISYKNAKTMTPYKYTVKYKVDGVQKSTTFYNKR